MPAGRKTGGRQAGTPNAVTASLREQVEQAAGGKPLPVLLAEVGTKALQKGEHHIAVTAFAKAATYVYPRLQAVTVTEERPTIPAPIITLAGCDACSCPNCADTPPGKYPHHKHVRQTDNGITIVREVIRGPEDLKT
jgi:hypothetical protein